MKWFVALLFAASAFAAPLNVRDVGVVGLMSHDLFAWDRQNERNTENGRLDLSTIFDWENGARVDKGGMPKNSENAPVYSVTMRLVKHYRTLCPKRADQRGEVCANARRSTVALFHSWVEASYQRLMGEGLPAESMNAAVDNTEQAVLRSLHDVLPGRIKLFRLGRTVDYNVTNAFTVKVKLNDGELAQELRPFDGDYDAEYQAIAIPFARVTVNLKKVDADFIAKFSPYRQEDMLVELASSGRGERDFRDVSFVHHLRDLLAKATCPNESGFMPAKDCR